MSKGRMEAFSDGVIAIIITIMVFDLKTPSSNDWTAFRPLVPVFLAYLMSFLYLAIYWNNHHHMLQVTERINGAVLWANLHLLFWLSLFPFVTSWMRSSGFSEVPTAVYGGVLLLAAIAYRILQRALIGAEGPKSRIAVAVGSDIKGNASLAAYTVACCIAFVLPWCVSLSIPPSPYCGSRPIEEWRP